MPMSSLLLFGALAATVHGQYAINTDAQPISILLGNSDSVGPDGPWWYISQAVDSPDQFMALLPALSNNSLIVNASACSSQSAKCPLPEPPLWSYSIADGTSGDNATFEVAEPASAWDSKYASLLNLSGSGNLFSQRMTLHPDGDTTISDELDYLVMGVSNNFTVGYSGGASYTMDVGFFSLFAEEAIVHWANEKGFVWYNNRTLNDAYYSGFIPSVSYGLHVGSVYPNVSGSLVLGGYDSSRCIGGPITSTGYSFTLSAIGLNVSSGSSAYASKNVSLPIENLLRDNGTTISDLEVYPDPGVPYMYLPQDTCDAIAAQIPVTYSSEFNLYLWNTSDPAYKEIVTSPHYLAFSFSESSGNTGTEVTIKVPFAVLNLTLESPLVSEATQYFPCSPWNPADVPYHLGRSFLQSAFLAQNWNSSTLWMAQAPGPDLLPEDIKTIAISDTTLTPSTDPPSWASTWSSTLFDLTTSNSTSNTTSSSISSTPTNKSSSGVSGGTIAGAVVGGIAGLAIVAGLVFLFLRRKRSRHQHGSQDVPLQESHHYHDTPASATTPPQYPYTGTGSEFKEKAQMLDGHERSPLVEAPSNPEPAEIDGNPQVFEMQGE